MTLYILYILMDSLSTVGTFISWSPYIPTWIHHAYFCNEFLRRSLGLGTGKTTIVKEEEGDGDRKEERGGRTGRLVR